MDKSFKIGAVVKLKNYGNINAIITNINKKKITVIVNNFSLDINQEDIEIMDSEIIVNKTSQSTKINLYTNSEFDPSIDLHGLSISQTEEILDKFLDKAIISNHKYLKIIHGKGTGALRVFVRNYLNNDTRVKEILVNNILFSGNSGVTWVEVK